jgi:hypothetical protein
VRIQKARKYQRAHLLVIPGRNERSVHQKDVMGTHELESIERETSQGRERKRESEKARNTHFLESTKGRVRYVKTWKVRKRASEEH